MKFYSDMEDNRYRNQPFLTLFYYEFTWTRDVDGKIKLVSIWD
jgi:hypothetical protein